jgi:outer membrane receptor protein involved in Fe transport
VKNILLFFLLLTAFALHAQNPLQQINVKGIVADSASNKPLSYATVVLVDVQSGKPIKSTLAKDNGGFEFTAVPNQSYKLQVAYIGYSSREVMVAVPSTKSTAELGIILLSAAKGTLKEVTIKGTKPVVKQEIDRLTYDVQADPESKANDALEMLRKVPMVTVDGSDNIKLNGGDSFQIFINGKPSALMASSPADVLKTMPAATILKIEVITTPPAKYDAEGLTGIINIITVKRKEEGFNGSVFGRYNNTWGERGTVSLAAKEDKFEINVFLGLGHQGMVNTQGGSQLISVGTDLSQQGYNLNGGDFHYGNVGLSYEIDSLNLFTATTDFNRRSFNNDLIRTSQLLGAGDSLLQSYQLANIGYNTWTVFDLGLNYQLGFKHHKDELLTFSYQYSSFTNMLTNAVNISDPVYYGGGDYSQQNNSGSNENTFQVDFVTPVQKTLTIEAGAKAIFRHNNSSFESENEVAPGMFIPDTASNNQFNYSQNVFSIYNSYQVKLAKWTVKGGYRAEHTTVNSAFIDGNTPLNQNYTNLLPSLSVQLNLGKNGSFNAGFTERIQRPSLSQLNPFVNRSDPDMIVTGNPALRPILSHLVELSYSEYAKVSLRIGLFYNYASNTIQNVTSLVSDTVSKTTFLNIGKNTSAGLNFSFNYPFTDKLNFRMNARLARVWLEGIYNESLFQNSGDRIDADGSLGYKFGDGCFASISGGYDSPPIYLQGKGAFYPYHAIMASKDFYNKKMTASLTIYSPFMAYTQEVNTLQTPDFIQSTTTRNISRNFRFGFNYKFGATNNTAKTSRRGIKNDDVQNGENEGSQ